jgi:hypothetical protein
VQLQPDIASFLRERGKVILSFSGGKDSLCVWCLLRELGVEVRPFYMQMVPGLSWIEDYLGYLERWSGVHVLRVQHPQPYHWLRTYSSQPPHRKGALDFLRLPRFDYPDVERGVRRTWSQRENDPAWAEAWVAVGTRTADSPQRRRSFQKYGWKREILKKVYPIHDFRKDDLIGVLKRNGVKLSPCYRMFGRSFDGVDFRFIDAIRTDYPDDYARIKEWMPLQDLEFHRVRFAQKHKIARVT